MSKLRFGKNTQFSRISNTVTHLWSYTNSAIGGNSATGIDVIMPSADVAATNTGVATSSADIVKSNGECSMMFQNVL